jgi:ABC-type lipoprotein export system ATPase subunit
MRNIASQSGVSFLIATHDHLLANSADRVLRIQDGQLA